MLKRLLMASFVLSIVTALLASSAEGQSSDDRQVSRSLGTQSLDIVNALTVSVSSEVLPPTHGFDDVPLSGWRNDAVYWMRSSGVTTGCSATEFCPDQEMTREQQITFLYRYAGEPSPGAPSPFSDVAAGRYYTNPVSWAFNNGITNGVSPTSFGTGRPITRAQAVTFLHRQAGEPVPSGANPFVDVPAGSYYTDPVRWAFETGITTGTSPTTFAPNQAVTRVQFAAFLSRYDNLITPEPDPGVTGGYPPVLTGTDDVLIAHGAEFDPASGVRATDPEDGEISASVTISGDVDVNTIGRYQVRYTVVDSDGNQTTASRWVTVEDQKPPTITLLGDTEVIHEQGEPYVDAGATAYDVLDGDLTDDIAVIGSVDSDTTGTYELVYHASDNAGNEATESRLVHVYSFADSDGDGVIDALDAFPNNADLQTILTPDEEDGNWSNKLLTESYSKNGDSSVVSGGVRYTANDLHNIEPEHAPSWAREGDYVLRFYGDGDCHPDNLDCGDYAYRAELSDSDSTISFVEEEERYYTLSFYPPSEEWDPVTKYSIVLSQWKQYDTSTPNLEVRFSNEGDYQLFVRSVPHFPDHEDTNSRGIVPIGVAQPDEWNDLKYYVRHSQTDGAFIVWLNGEQVFEYYGPTLQNSRNGYIKFGMYTEIRDERLIYFDGVRITSSLMGESLEEWIVDQAHLPEVSILRPIDNANPDSGETVVLAAEATDPGGIKLGTSGNIVAVEFFEGENSLGVDTDAPYELEWTPNHDGAYSITVNATDSDGHIATSEAVEIYVGNRPPVVGLTNPLEFDNLSIGETISIEASATEPDGEPLEVQFYVGADLVGSDVSAPFSIDWTADQNGAFEVTAVANDGAGNFVASDPVRITVGSVLESASVSATDDATLKENDADANANYGRFQARGSDDGDTFAGVIKFDVAGSHGAAEVRSATLRLYAYYVMTPTTISVFSGVGDDWSEDSVTWNNGPTRGGKLSELEISSAGAYVEFEVTDFVSSAVDSLDSLITFWLEDEVTDGSDVQFYSLRGDSPYPPELVITTSTIDIRNAVPYT